MDSHYNYKDIIDLEYFLHLDETAISNDRQQEIRNRDREIYMQNFGDGDSVSPQHMIKAWLANRRAAEKEGGEVVLAGEIFVSGYRLLTCFFIGIGLIVGIAATSSFLHYTGSQPVNVFDYLFFMVFLQIVLLVIFVVLMGVRRWKKNQLITSPLYNQLSKFFVNRLLATQKNMLNRLGAEKRQSLIAVFGNLRGRAKVYGSLFFNPLFQAVQYGALAFNSAVLFTTMFKVVGTDIAFGWQSTMNLSSQVISQIVRWLAIPWAWIVPQSFAFPTLAEIEGSHIILKDGLYHLTTGDLTSWWFFLWCSVLVYGFLPRLVLCLYSSRRAGKMLAELKFDHAAAVQLLRRMQEPLVATSGRTKPLPVEDKLETDFVHPVEESSGPEQKVKEKNFILLLPDEMFDGFCADKQAEQQVLASGEKFLEIYRIGVDYSNDQQIMAALAKRGQEEYDGIILLQKAWMPPIVAHFELLSDLRKAVGDGLPVRLILVGRHRENRVVTSPTPDNYQLWKKRTAGLADPWLDLIAVTDREVIR